MKHRITSRAILAGGLAIAILAAFAGSASALRTLVPNAAGFSAINIGTVSQATQFYLHVMCDYDFDLQQCTGPDSFSPQISLDPPSEFIQTNDCPQTLNGFNESGQGCTIEVRFAPTRVGEAIATLRTGDAGLTSLVNAAGVIPVRLAMGSEVQRLRHAITMFARSNHDSTLRLAGGGITPTVSELVAGERRRVRAPLKPAARVRLARKLRRQGKAKTTVIGTATEGQHGRSVDDRVTIRFRR
jgi:hypothetical protein